MRILVGAAAGGATDIITRILTEARRTGTNVDAYLHSAPPAAQRALRKLNGVR